MKKNVLYKSLAGTAMLAAAMTANAKVETFSVGFVTIQDLTITQDQGLSFAQKIVGKAGTSCTMTFAENATSSVTTKAAAANFNDAIAGNGCIDDTTAASNGYMGVYTIAGQVSQTVSVTVASITETDFTFSPSAQLITDGADINAAGSYVTVFADSPQTDATGTTGNLVLLVGGTLNVVNDLTANTPYSGSFDITAVY